MFQILGSRTKDLHDHSLCKAPAAKALHFVFSSVLKSPVNRFLFKRFESEMASLTNLPLEVLVRILENVDPNDIIDSVSLTCKQLNIASKVELLWEKVCFKHFGIDFGRSNREDGSPRLFYQKILRKYGQFLGPNSCASQYIRKYGSLFQLMYDDAWGLLMIQWFPPEEPYVSRPLRPYKCFTIHRDKGQETVRCWDDIILYKKCIFDTEWSEATLRIFPSSLSLDVKSSQVFQKQSKYNSLATDYYRKDNERFLEREGLRANMMSVQKYGTMKQKESPSMLFTGLTTSKSFRDGKRVPIKPGLFKGNYGDHGIEIIQLGFDDLGNGFGLKITGDHNVPAMQNSFQFSLSDAFEPLSFSKRHVQQSVEHR